MRSSFYTRASLMTYRQAINWIQYMNSQSDRYKVREGYWLRLAQPACTRDTRRPDLKLKDFFLFCVSGYVFGVWSVVDQRHNWWYDLPNKPFQRREARRTEQEHNPHYLKDDGRGKKSRRGNDLSGIPVAAIDLTVPLHVPGMLLTQICLFLSSSHWFIWTN